MCWDLSVDRCRRLLLSGQSLGVILYGSLTTSSSLVTLTRACPVCQIKPPIAFLASVLYQTVELRLLSNERDKGEKLISETKGVT
ncbi:hypothetical protein RRG08_020191 [Elysia crispata]|uniref:Uncharacterized protein n=1 Tax=Elysia crispata TaxID=231223 RepID=A0AAE1A3K3_9GAST|nr:hypothetical protein RRG08_020191 [Elysia crispata]